MISIPYLVHPAWMSSVSILPVDHIQDLGLLPGQYQVAVHSQSCIQKWFLHG